MHQGVADESTIKCVLNASVVHTGDSARSVLNMMNFGSDNELGCERPLTTWKIFRNELGGPRAEKSCLFNLISRSRRNSWYSLLAGFESRKSPVLLKIFWAFRFFIWS